MLQKFQNHINSNFSFLKDKRILLAVSGGIDSMVMVDLFSKLNFDIAIVNCDFQLRGKESFDDSVFVGTFCANNNIDSFWRKFNTLEFANENKISIQQAARKLRYDRFNELLVSAKFDFVATAHHLDDQLETFLINFSRGTGLDGLTGIPAINENVIRPLLIFSREEIQDYANENNIQWREDSSNASDKYLRNKIRHHIVPLLKENNTSFLTSFQNTLDNLTQEKSLVDDATQKVFKKVVSEENNQLKFNISALLQYKNYQAYLYQWLHEYEFSAWADIYNLVHAQSGKQIFSEDFILLKDRDFLILSSKKKADFEEFIINSITDKPNFPLKLTLCNQSNSSIQNKNVIFVDESKLHFPLTLRKWKEGDYFYPSGMQGKKKLSKFFKDEKFTLFQKQDTWILESNNQIVWIIGHRADERFKAENTTQTTIKLEFNNEKNT